MKEEQGILLAYWWDKLYPLRRKFVGETLLKGFEKEDIEQECFLQLHKAIERYNPHMGVPFESYYKVILHGWRANQNRSKINREIAFEEEEFFFMKDERTDIERDVEKKLLVEEVMHLIEQLEEKERGIIKAYYLQHKKIKEIATQYGIAYKTVEAKKKKALSRLRAMVV